MVEYQKQQIIALEKANELQNTANELQQEIIIEIETNNRVTSTHNTAIKRLTVAIVVLGVLTIVLGVLTIWANYSKTGRYTVSATSEYGDVFVLDTKTGKLQRRTLKDYSNGYK